MNRIHIGLEVADLEKSVAFYSQMFGCEPVVLEKDYAKWTPNEPSVNLSVTSRGEEEPGSVHFGVEVQDKADLDLIAGRLADAGEKVIPTGCTECCYHKSEKAWIIDPDANRWETFYSTGRHTDYGEDEPELGIAHKERLAEIASHA
jgi:catechol 2,3-dioxygenase-like lactoylglutathione lyase family enzyme